jgi:two-component system KDP operon response regulator KdpE
MVVDDDPGIRNLAKVGLEGQSYYVKLAEDGASALKMIESENPDLIVLDIKMPGIDGTEVIKRLRKWSPIPIIAISAFGTWHDEVSYLDMGADDFLSKPFYIEDLAAHVRAVLRRVTPEKTDGASPTFKTGDIKVDFTDRRVWVKQKELTLTPTEFALLSQLVQNANKVMTHRVLLQNVWGPEFGKEREYVRTYVAHLRKLIEDDPEHPKYIINVPKVGYRFQTRESS